MYECEEKKNEVAVEDIRFACAEQSFDRFTKMMEKRDFTSTEQFKLEILRVRNSCSHAFLMYLGFQNIFWVVLNFIFHIVSLC